MDGADRLVGVLGGMGPDATVDFMSKVIALTPSGCDQDHVRMLVDHNPRVPDRHAAILSNGENPGPVLAEMAGRLETGGAEFLVITCNTAHVFQDAVLAATRIPLLSIVDETIATVSDVRPRVRLVGVMATEGCLHADVFQSGLRAKGLIPVLPSGEDRSATMRLIRAIKAGDRSLRVAAEMSSLAWSLVDRGAEAVIVGCTEIPLVLSDDALEVPLISSTDVLAEKTVQIALGRVPLPER